MYLGELRLNWRYLVAAAVGLSFGYAINAYITSIFSPHLIREFGWTKAQFAMLGVTIIIGVVGMPIAGRLTDLFGTRRMAMVGVILSPLLYLVLSLAEGSFAYFLSITILQVTLVGTTTTTAVYSRLIAQRFDRARGLALSLIACSPPAVAAALAPMLGAFIDAWGWRAGYVAVAVATALGGGIALALLFTVTDKPRETQAGQSHRTMAEYRAILRNAAFRIIAVAILLCNLTHTVIASQLKLILLDREMSSDFASGMISLFAIGTMAGRLFSGFALDRFPSQIVAALVLGSPGIGLLLLGSGGTATPLVALSVLLIGLATGAELDIVAYLVMRFFPVEVYGTAYGMVAAAIAVSSALGSLFLSLMLGATGSFAPYLLITAVTTVGGAALFLLLRPSSHRLADAAQTQSA